ncbi:hypothetical protein B0T26DRAFT_724596 [Lasiosphaeria miniovina]|uniref:Uncharacterized protein n=1 Tax=Lasiosphaeria miniovina TaxID=1954250 RepID=A0AA40A6Y2_9PEZI|nr:uncharacterized protein B0T26DRAFT_724596 [Lasiosphaeria miniovina]KAK0710335.1 hypothetical protein B0T26DRAFT_724596 [Lasiosphaeria miniovina]
MADRENEILAVLLLLSHIFIGKGLDNCQSLFKEYYIRRKELETVSTISTTISSELKELGCTTLFRFVSLWGFIKLEETEGPRCRDLRHLKAHLELVRIWESINLQDATRLDELKILRRSETFQKFLTDKKLVGKRVSTHKSQLTSFVAHQLGITNKKFTITASRYKPLLTLVRHFGGVLAFIPRSRLLVLFRRVRNVTAKEEEQILSTIITRMTQEFPGISDLCSETLRNMVEPILEEKDLPPTLGLTLLSAEEISTFQSKSVWEMVINGANTSPKPRVFELQDEDGSEANNGDGVGEESFFSDSD